MPQTSLSGRLTDLRQTCELSQAAVAEAVLGSKKRQPEVSRWESGEVIPSAQNLLALAKLYSFDATELLHVACLSEEAETLSPTG